MLSLNKRVYLSVLLELFRTKVILAVLNVADPSEPH